ncbi:MAG: hypothetical protein ABSB82_13640 [Terriglobia bacterium]|jgi:hypothetical protein
MVILVSAFALRYGEGGFAAGGAGIGGSANLASMIAACSSS